jgi:hypothetical protein
MVLFSPGLVYLVMDLVVGFNNKLKIENNYARDNDLWGERLYWWTFG